MINRVVGLYFSPSGGTAKITEQISEEVAERLQQSMGYSVDCVCHDISEVPASNMDFDEDTVVVIGMPVIVGKLPIPAISKLKAIKGSGAMTVGIVSYGTMSYGNALYELHHYTKNQGFKTIGAGAFVAKHKGVDGLTRPDLRDLEEIRDFAKALAGKLTRLSGSQVEALRIKPAPVYIAGTLPVHRISRFSPFAAFMAERTFEKVTVFRKNPEWYL